MSGQGSMAAFARARREDVAIVSEHAIVHAKRRYFALRERIVGHADDPNLAAGPLPAFGAVIDVDGIRMRVDPRMSEFNIRKLMTGRHTRHERELILPRLRDGDTVMELGGGIGMVAIACARRLGSGRVFSYEANPELESLIRDNYALNDVAPTLRMAMLGREAGTRTFHLAERFSHSSAQLGGAGTRPVEVPVAPFDAHLASNGANVLVIDIQGGEVELLEHVDLSAVRLLLVELHPFIVGLVGVLQVRSRLRRQGLRLCERSGQSLLFERQIRAA